MRMDSVIEQYFSDATSAKLFIATNANVSKKQTNVVIIYHRFIEPNECVYSSLGFNIRPK